MLHKDLHKVAAVGIWELLVRKFSTMWSEASRDRFSNRCHLSSGSSEEVWQQRLECSCSRGGDLPTSSSCSLLSFFADFLRSASSRWAWISDRRSAGGVAFEGISEKCHVRFHRASRARLSQGRARLVRCSSDRHHRASSSPPVFFLGCFAAASPPFILAARRSFASCLPERRGCRIASAASTELGAFI